MIVEEIDTLKIWFVHWKVLLRGYSNK